MASRKSTTARAAATGHCPEPAYWEMAGRLRAAGRCLPPMRRPAGVVTKEEDGGEEEPHHQATPAPAAARRCETAVQALAPSEREAAMTSGSMRDRAQKTGPITKTTQSEVMAKIMARSVEEEQLHRRHCWASPGRNSMTPLFPNRRLPGNDANEIAGPEGQNSQHQQEGLHLVIGDEARQPVAGGQAQRLPRPAPEHDDHRLHAGPGQAVEGGSLSTVRQAVKSMVRSRFRPSVRQKLYPQNRHQRRDGRESTTSRAGKISSHDLRDLRRCSCCSSAPGAWVATGRAGSGALYRDRAGAHARLASAFLLLELRWLSSCPFLPKNPHPNPSP